MSVELRSFSRERKSCMQSAMWAKSCERKNHKNKNKSDFKSLYYNQIRIDCLTKVQYDVTNRVGLRARFADASSIWTQGKVKVNPSWRVS